MFDPPVQAPQPASSTDRYDCIIVGGGPAGLSAGLLLGRCRRRVLVCDDGRPRNAAAFEVHGFLTRDGTPPRELRRLGGLELDRYGVERRHVTVADARRVAEGFEVVMTTGEQLVCRKLLLASGVRDELPAIDGIAEYYGKGVFHCPYCDGWENRDGAIAIYGQGRSGAGLALTVSNWSTDVVLCTNGESGLSHRDRVRLHRRGVAIRSERIRRLEGDEGRLARIVFDEGQPLPRTALFVHTEQRQQNDLARRLGCDLDEKGCVRAGTLEATNVSGLYVAGDASRDVQLAIVAAAEGARAAFAINKSLLEDELLAHRRQSARRSR